MDSSIRRDLSWAISVAASGNDHDTMNTAHLYDCPALDVGVDDGEDEQLKIARLYWAGRRQMAQQTRVGIG